MIEGNFALPRLYTLRKVRDLLTSNAEKICTPKGMLWGCPEIQWQSVCRWSSVWVWKGRLRVLDKNSRVLLFVILCFSGCFITVLFPATKIFWSIRKFLFLSSKIYQHQLQSSCDISSSTFISALFSLSAPRFVFWLTSSRRYISNFSPNFKICPPLLSYSSHSPLLHFKVSCALNYSHFVNQVL